MKSTWRKTYRLWAWRGGGEGAGAPAERELTLETIIITRLTSSSLGYNLLVNSIHIYQEKEVCRVTVVLS